LDALGEPLATLDKDSAAYQAVEEMTTRVLGSS